MLPRCLKDGNRKRDFRKWEGERITRARGCEERRQPTDLSTYYCFGHRATMAAILDMRKYPPHCPRPSTNSPIHPRADSTPHPRYRSHTLASSPPSELTPYSLPPSFKVRDDVFLSPVGSLHFLRLLRSFFPPEFHLFLKSMRSAIPSVRRGYFRFIRRFGMIHVEIGSMVPRPNAFARLKVRVGRTFRRYCSFHRWNVEENSISPGYRRKAVGVGRKASVTEKVLLR